MQYIVYVHSEPWLCVHYDRSAGT